jgi:hypothetical protein
MFTTNLVEFKTRWNELHRQAENYRLVKSQKESYSLVSRVVITVGKLMVSSGQQLVTLSRAAN